jgi:hypothetical protein
MAANDEATVFPGADNLPADFMHPLFSQVDPGFRFIFQTAISMPASFLPKNSRRCWTFLAASSPFFVKLFTFTWNSPIRHQTVTVVTRIDLLRRSETTFQDPDCATVPAFKPSRHMASDS